ncbi:hypothetical protein GCM10010359_34060 [Streptomyces morookaense]|nr:hypothetical protein GCM10010359_34060 [Streptomyces morookaense]
MGVTVPSRPRRGWWEGMRRQCPVGCVWRFAAAAGIAARGLAPARTGAHGQPRAPGRTDSLPAPPHAGHANMT